MHAFVHKKAPPPSSALLRLRWVVPICFTVKSVCVCVWGGGGGCFGQFSPLIQLLLEWDKTGVWMRGKRGARGCMIKSLHTVIGVLPMWKGGGAMG